jgi:ABC-type sugar transport system ATPase subunit
MRVRFEGVSKRFGTHVALRHADLEVHAGECLVLLGPSGCGKTTLLRLLAGLERADEGRIWIGDRVVNDVDPADRDVAMVFQNYALYPHFTVFENIAFPLRARGVANGEIDGRVRAAAARVALDTMLDRRPAQLSGGQQQRVALARAIVRNPAVYQELVTTMVYVTHDQAEAMTLAGRIAIVQQGAIVQIGAPLDLYRKPANTFVATFLGNPAMNIFDDSGNGAPVKIGIRPEDVQVSTTAREGWHQARAVVVEPMGNEMLVTLDWNGRRLVARTSPDLAVQGDGLVWIQLVSERLHVFDLAGNRL